MLIKNKHFTNINLINLLIALIPFSLILGNLAVNINIILICLSGIIIYKFEIFEINDKIYQYLIYSFFLYLILITLITNISSIINFEPRIAGRYFNITKELYLENIAKSFLFLRFLILFLVVNKLIEKNSFNLKLFYISCSFFVFVISVDIVIQAYLGKNLFGYPILFNRPTSFFGDEFVACGYIQKFSLFFIFLFVTLSEKKKGNLFFFLLSVAFLFPIILTVNRMPLMLYVLSIFIILISRKQLKSTLIFLLIFLLIFFSVLKFYPKTRMGMNLKKFTTSTTKIFNAVINFRELPKQIAVLKTLSLPEEKVNIKGLDRAGYILHFSSALQIWETNKIFGYGIKSFKFKCTYEVGQTCASHPHNYYLELLLDTGVVGLGLIFLLFVYSVFNFFNFYRYSSSKNLKFFATPFFILIILEFFPIRSTGSFFSTSNAIIIFFMLAVVVGTSNHKKSYKNNFIIS